MDKLYKIKVIAVSLKGNKIGKSGDVVKGSEFINLEDSVKGGFCEEVKAESKKEEPKKEEPKKEVKKETKKEEPKK